MVTQLQSAKDGVITPQMIKVAVAEGIEEELLRELIASGQAVILSRSGLEPVGIGTGLRTKINVNIGTSADVWDVAEEIRKAEVANEMGAHVLTDLSMGGPIDEIRSKVFAVSKLATTTVPIYQAMAEARSFTALSGDDLVDQVLRHGSEGVSSVVVHAAFNRATLDQLRSVQRIMGMVSKGGSMTAVWMLRNEQENPFLERFDALCEGLARTDCVLSLGNTMRAGCIHDEMDTPMRTEMEMAAQLAVRANDYGVQVIINGLGGHADPRMIPEYVARYKTVTGGRPLFVAGPMPMEVSVGHDHIAACVGASIAGGAGADFLCYITPAEHLKLPSVAEVREGIIAYRIAAHIADTIKFGRHESDRRLSAARMFRNWPAMFSEAIDPQTATEKHPDIESSDCTMCGMFCPMAQMESFLLDHI